MDFRALEISSSGSAKQEGRRFKMKTTSIALCTALLALTINVLRCPIRDTAEPPHRKTDPFSGCLYTLSSVEYHPLPPRTDLGRCAIALTEPSLRFQQDRDCEQFDLTRRYRDRTRWTDCSVPTLFKTAPRYRTNSP